MSSFKNFLNDLVNASTPSKNVQADEDSVKPNGLNGIAASYQNWYIGGIIGCLAVMCGSEIFALHYSVFTVEAFGEDASWTFSSFASVLIQFIAIGSFLGALHMRRKAKRMAAPALILGMVVIMGYEVLFIIPHVPEAFRSVDMISNSGVAFMLGLLYFCVTMLIFFKLKVFFQTEIDHRLIINPYELKLMQDVCHNMAKSRGYGSFSQMIASSVVTGSSQVNENGQLEPIPEKEEDKEPEPAGN
ncbi:MAG: hypothetical protein AAFR66_17040 [Bacteroidota bacterium]